MNTCVFEHLFEYFSFHRSFISEYHVIIQLTNSDQLSTFYKHAFFALEFSFQYLFMNSNKKNNMQEWDIWCNKIDRWRNVVDIFTRGLRVILALKSFWCLDLYICVVRALFDVFLSV